MPEGFLAPNILPMKKITTFLALSLIFAASCNENEGLAPEKKPKADQQAIDNFIRFLDFTQKELEKRPRLSQEEITEIVTASIPLFESKTGINLSGLSRPAIKGRLAYENYGEVEVLQNMIDITATSTSENAFIENVQSLAGQVENGSLSFESKEYLLTNIGLEVSLVSYLDDIEALRRAVPITSLPNKVCDGWWTCWGKCAVGVVGSAGLGALTGANLGGAGCTVIVPIYGTVACGTVGAIAGAIFGGMKGYDACD